MLGEAVSMPARLRLADLSANTVPKLFRGAGEACTAYRDGHVRDITGERPIQCDEVWSFVCAKQISVEEARLRPVSGHRGRRVEIFTGGQFCSLLE